MNGKPVAQFHIFVVFMVSSGLAVAAETRKVQTGDNYLKIIKPYADAMLEHERGGL